MKKSASKILDELKDAATGFEGESDVEQAILSFLRDECSCTYVDLYKGVLTCCFCGSRRLSK